MHRNVDYLECKICKKKAKNIGQHLYYSHKNLDAKTYYDLYIKNGSEDICPICGKSNTFFSIRAGYSKHCSAKCAQIDSNVRNKQANTNLKKYGHICSLASEQAKNKTNNTKLQRYGSKTYNNATKMKQTKLDKYGEYYINPEKTKATNMKRYGVECSFQDRGARLKALNTMRKNGNRSSYETLLENFLKENNIKYEQEYNLDTRYPYHCDFYLPDTDTFIEINVYWTHGKHFFNKNNKDDQKILKIWKTKAKQGLTQYKNAITVWTKLDLEKKEKAEKEHIKYIVLWNKQDIETFIKNYKI